MLTVLMRLLVLSDIHADARALEAVLADSASLGWDQVLLLGDLIGYGDEPDQVLSTLRSLPLRAAIRGNHEAMLLRLLHGGSVAASPEIVTVLARHAEQLSAGNLEFLAALPETHAEADSGWQLAHGSPRRSDEYVLSSATARASSASLQQPVCFIGHTHVPAVYYTDDTGRWRLRPVGADGTVFTLPADARALLNPGSVWRVRDAAGGSSYAVYDEESRKFMVRRLTLG
jgi:predicted phosphodiesterase